MWPNVNTGAKFMSRHLLSKCNQVLIKKRQEKDKQIGPSWPFTLPTKSGETDRSLRQWTGVCQRDESETLRRRVCV